MDVSMLSRRSSKGDVGFVEWERPLFWLTVVATVATIWIPHRLPMVDIPQHAAQVVAWRAILEGHFAWADLVELKYLNPYLLGYGLLLPLTYIMSVTAATKFLLSASFLAFVWLCILLRRELGGDKGLDWFFLFGFFGMGWQWGFLTYLCAAPLVILFIIVALRQADDNSPKNQLLVLLAGCALLFSHGLQFLFAVTIGGLFILINRCSIGDKIRAYAPYYALAILTVGVRWAMDPGKNLTVSPTDAVDLVLWLRRPLTALYRVSGGGSKDWAVIPPLLAFAVPLLPVRRPGPLRAWIPFAVCAAVLLFVPSTLMSTAYVYQRFSLFLLPFWALAFRPDEAAAAPPAWQSPLRFAVLAIAALSATAVTAQRQLAFARNSAGFETVLAAAEPNRRALSLIYERSEPNASVPEYLHYPAWYQAEKGGFVDFNFAYFFSLIVRYRRDRMPTLTTNYGYMSPQTEIAADLPLFDYLFIRGTPEEVDQMLKNNPQCQFKLRAEDGFWRLLEKEKCAAPN